MKKQLRKALSSLLITSMCISGFSETAMFNKVYASEVHTHEKKITVAILDSGIATYETEEHISLVKELPIEGGHGDEMAETLLNENPEVSILDVKVLNNDGEGNYSDVKKGIIWAVDRGADIITMSFTGYTPSTILEEAVDYAEKHGVILVAAAGNNGEEDKSVFPASYGEVISVGATDAQGNIADFSNYGCNVDTYVYAEIGTSFAAPKLAGKIAKAMGHSDVSEKEINDRWNAGTSDFVYSSVEVDGVVYATACTHKWVFQRSTSATCTNPTTTYYKCSKCSATKINKSGSPLGHKAGAWTTTTAATCTMKGTQKQYCTRCNKVMNTRQTALAPHNYQLTKTVAATCTASGYKLYKCSGCSDSYTTKTSEATGHTAGAWKTTTKATCTTKGTQKQYCSKCNAVMNTRQIALVPHNYQLTKTVAATCTASGYKLYKCSGCNDSYTTKTSEATGHTAGAWTTTTKATCTTKGTQKQYCTKCNAVVKTRQTALTAHDYKVTKTVAATCTTDGYKTYKCSVCGDTATTKTSEATGHTAGAWKTTTEATCTTKGTQKQYCTKCNALVNTRQTGLAPHDYKVTKTVAATCTTDGYNVNVCSMCKDSYTSITTSKLGHNTTTTTKPATCTTDGSKKTVCNRPGCSYSITTIIPASGHVEGQWVTKKESTCCTKGTTEQCCTKCNAVLNTKQLPLKPCEYIAANGGECKNGYVIKKCKWCGTEAKTSAINMEQTENNWNNGSWYDTYGHYYVCSVCNANSNVPSETHFEKHVYDDGYASVNPEFDVVTCKICHYTNMYKQHDFQNITFMKYLIPTGKVNANKEVLTNAYVYCTAYCPYCKRTFNFLFSDEFKCVKAPDWKDICAKSAEAIINIAVSFTGLDGIKEIAKANDIISSISTMLSAYDDINSVLEIITDCKEIKDAVKEKGAEEKYKDFTTSMKQAVLRINVPSNNDEWKYNKGKFNNALSNGEVDFSNYN